MLNGVGEPQTFRVSQDKGYDFLQYLDHVRSPPARISHYKHEKLQSIAPTPYMGEPKAYCGKMFYPVS
jgi:hypothetical protein